MRKIAAILFMAFLATASAQSYYADITVEIAETGISDIAGITNHPQLKPGKTDNLTSKIGSHWLFNLTTPEKDVFSDLIYEIRLPDKAAVNYVKTKGQFTIQTKDNAITIKAVGQNTPLSMVIQYSLEKEEQPQTPLAYVIIVAALFVLVALAIYALRKRGAGGYAEDKLLTDRQKRILEYVSASKEPVNQNQVAEKLGLPKAAVSRNTETLVRRGHITKERVGVNTYLVKTRKE